MGSLLGCSLAAILLAGTGMTAQPVETIVQDDAVLLHRSDSALRRAVTELRDMGTDRVRITAGWAVIAPGPYATQRPAGFDPRDTRTYPQPSVRTLDRAVAAVVARGMDVQIDLAFWAPRWAVRRGAANRDRHRRAPDAREFADFSAAIARRYSGHFSDPANGVLRLPRFDRYTTWNEPNYPLFLGPQWRRTKTGFRPYSPHVYRPMHELAYDEIKAVDKSNEVLIGGLAQSGSSRPGRGAVAPLEFLRALACVDDDLAPLEVKECRGYEPLRADGFAMHPYSKGVAPGVRAPGADDVFLADLDKLQLLISRLHNQGRTDADWPVYVTEYGYETRPPDPGAQVSLAEQARYLGWANYIAHTQPGVRSFAQFLLRDIRFPRRAPGTDWQTGLLYANGDPKPSAMAFKLPLFAAAADAPDGSRGLVLHGGVRPGRGREVVRVERRGPGTEVWLPVTTVGTSCDETTGAFVTDSDGFFRRTATWEGPGEYRLVWERGGFSEVGPAIAVDGTVLSA